MKSKLPLACIAALFPAVASATTIFAGGGTLGRIFQTSSGILLTNTNSSIDVGKMQGSSFIEFAPNEISPIMIFTVSAPQFHGKWSGAESDLTTAADAFNGETVWFRVSFNLGGDSGVAYFSSGALFPTNSSGVGDSLTVNSTSLTTVGADSTTGSLIDTTNDIIVIGVPEPSSLLLGLLAGLPLLRRRR